MINCTTLTYFSSKLSDPLLWRVEWSGAGSGQLLRQSRILESQQSLEGIEELRKFAANKRVKSRVFVLIKSKF